ncbi:hypothetical protein RvY_01037-2 [Ramazzottius varieornatus]|uniref:STAS domain-containing protein n=1 Tax=Ramazzottius varieornatus TaxID=947166 RepID=A0A1D1UM31_RAMVA|nr:hypothetical protein RvY_01037-2 [Ramazzottius varieornatus]
MSGEELDLDFKYRKGDPQRSAERTFLTPEILELYGESEVPHPKNFRHEPPGRVLTAEVLELYGEEVDAMAQPKALVWENVRDALNGIRPLLRRRLYGANKSSQEFLSSSFPLFSRLKHYQAAWIPRDILAGFIVGMIQFTQVFGNSQTATVRPTSGLNILLFPGLVYAFMASSLYNSLGGTTIAVATLRVSLGYIEDQHYPGGMNGKHKMTDTELMDLHTYIAPGIAFIAGFVQIGLGFLKLGFLYGILSPNVMEPFFLACFLQSICGKVPSAFGLEPPVIFGFAQQFQYLYFFLTNLGSINGWETLLSFAMASTVLVFREFWQPRIFTRYRLVAPIEFILFVIFSIISYLADFRGKGIRVVGSYSYGVPRPTVPDLSYGWPMAFAGIVLAIVTYSATLDSAKVLARKHDPPVSANQELLALGVAHVFGSFFACFPVGAPIGRGRVNQSMGSRSQLSTLVACVFAGIVIGYAGPAIQYLPLCVVSTNMILFLSMSLTAFKELPRLWAFNNIDAAVWILTFACGMLLNVQVGLFVGVSVSLLSLIVRSQRPKVRVLGLLKDTQWGIAALKHHSEIASELPGVRILQIQSPVNYANADYLVKEVMNLALEPYEANAVPPPLPATAFADRRPDDGDPFRHTTVSDVFNSKNPAVRALAYSRSLTSLGLRPRKSIYDFPQRVNGPRTTFSNPAVSTQPTLGGKNTATRVVLDMGSVGYIDTVGIRALEQIASDAKIRRVEIILAQCTGDLFISSMLLCTLTLIIPIQLGYNSVSQRTVT